MSSDEDEDLIPVLFPTLTIVDSDEDMREKSNSTSSSSTSSTSSRDSPWYEYNFWAK